MPTTNGTITVVDGKMTTPDNTSDSKQAFVNGINTGKSGTGHTYYPMDAETIFIADTYILGLPQGYTTPSGKDVKITTASGNTTYATLKAGFAVATMTSGKVLKVTEDNDVLTLDADDTSGCTTKNWSGTLEINHANFKMGGANLGDIETKVAYAMAANQLLYGNLKIGDNLTLTTGLTVKQGASINENGKKILLNGATVTYVKPSDLDQNLYSATQTTDAYKIVLDGVTNSSGNFTISDATVSGYSSGSVTFGTSLTAVAVSGEIGTLTATGATLSFGEANINGNLDVKTIAQETSDAVKVLNLRGSTAKISDDGTVKATANSAKIVISQNTVMTITDDAKTWTIGQNTTLDVLGQITGGKLATQSNEYGAINTPTGEAGGYILSDIEGVITSSDQIGESEGTADSFATLKGAISDGYSTITYTGSLTIAESLEIPAGVTVTGVGAITISSGATFTVAGTLRQTGAVGIVLQKNTSTTSSDRTAMVIEGTVTTGTNGVQVADGTTLINDGTLTITGVPAGEASVVGIFENAGVMYLAGDGDYIFIIGNASGGVKTEFENTGRIEFQNKDADIQVQKKGTLVNTGIIDYDDTEISKADAEGITIYGEGTFDNEGDGLVGIAVNTASIKGVTSTVKISENITQSSTYMGLQTVQIPEGATLELTQVARTTVNGQMIIDGDITIYGTLTIASGAHDAKSASLTVNGTVTVAKGGKLVIGTDASAGGMKGALTVNSTGSVVVMEGGYLTFDYGTGSDIKGSLTMDEGSFLTIRTASAEGAETSVVSDLKVSGTADLNGYLNGSVAISNAGVISIDNGANAVRNSSTTGTADANANTALTINMVKDGAVLNLDSLLIEGASTALNTTWTKFTVTDAGLYTYYKSSSDYRSILDSNNDQIVIGFSNVKEEGTSTGYTPSKVVAYGSLVIKQSASYKMVKVNDVDQRAQTYGMDLSGAISAGISYTGVTLETIQDKLTMDVQTAGTTYYSDYKTAEDSGCVTVSDVLSIDEYVSTTFSAEESGSVLVTGTIINNESGAAQILMDRTGSITVYGGEIVSSNEIDTSTRGVVNAVYYKTVIGTGKDKVTTHYYTTLEDAIDGVQIEGNTADKVVEIRGTVTLTEDAVLPETVKMKLADKAYLYIGYGTVRPTLTAEAQITANKQITVNGTLTFVDQADDKTSKTVSDVTYTTGDSKTYTNVYTAIDNAGKSSEEMTITVTKEPGTTTADKVYLTENLVIPSNVTLVVGDAEHVAGLYLYDGVTLTVDGTLNTSQDIVAEHRFAVVALDVESTSKYSSAVVVNGMLMFADSVTPVYGAGIAYGTTNAEKLSASAPVYGAWYQITGWNVISNIDAALAETKVTSAAVTVNGPVVGSDGTVTKNTNSTYDEVVIGATLASPYGSTEFSIASSLTMNSLTLGTETAFTATAGQFTGTVQVGENAVVFSKMKGFVATEDEGALVLTGSITTAKENTAKISAGTVTLGSSSAGFEQKGSVYSLSIASGATAVVAGSNDAIANLSVSGALEVPTNTALTVTKLVVSGSVKVADTTSSVTGGTLNVTDGYVGISSSNYYDKNLTAAAATVSGPFNLIGKIAVSSSATVDKDMSACKSTEFYNNGSLWFTVYASQTAADAYKTITVNKAPIENAVLAGWSKTEGGDAITSGTSTQWTFTIGDNSKLYSVVDTFIYKIVIKADQGIGDLYLNGNIMSKGQVIDNGYMYYAYWATVEAGDYTVTSKLSNGFSGTPVLKDTAGATVSNNKFSVSGDAGTTTFQLTGVTASGYVQPTEEKKDNGLTVTDYLLIVLVILVVILAVIVALRLMRS